MNSHHAASPSYSHAILPHLANTYNIHFAPSSPAHPTGCDYLNPRPDGSIVVGGGSWFYQNKHSHSGQDPYKWLDTVDDSEESGHFPASVYAHWSNYMVKTFLGWGGEEKEDKVKVEPDSIWTGIQGQTGDGMPHVGRVPSSSPPSTLAVPYPPESIVDMENRQKKQQWLLAGFNGGGMALIPLVAKAVAKMALQDKEFEDVREEFGLLEGMGTGGSRMTDVEGMGMS
jgi:glycine/D-amino acid oxidase-like deaminating enzyme